MAEHDYKDFAEYLVGVGRENAGFVMQHLGHPYMVADGKAVPLPHPPLEPFTDPQVIQVYTLSGLIRILEANVDQWDLSELLILADEDHVQIFGPLEGERRRRPYYGGAIYKPEGSPSGYGTLREFRILCRRAFAPSEELDRLLADTSKVAVKSAAIREEGEDGLGWATHNARDQVANTQATVANPVYDLQPWRSFPEAGDQQVVPFLCQLTGGEDEPTKAMLIDVGGNAWIAAAAEQVGKHVLKLAGEASLALNVVW